MNKKGEILEGKCTSCKEPSKFKYLGPQENYNGKPPLHLYNCIKCNTTLAFKTIRDAINKLSK